LPPAVAVFRAAGGRPEGGRGTAARPGSGADRPGPFPAGGGIPDGGAPAGRAPGRAPGRTAEPRPAGPCRGAVPPGAGPGPEALLVAPATRALLPEPGAGIRGGGGPGRLRRLAPPVALGVH